MHMQLHMSTCCAREPIDYTLHDVTARLQLLQQANHTLSAVPSALVPFKQPNSGVVLI